MDYEMMGEPIEVLLKNPLVRQGLIEGYEKHGFGGIDRRVARIRYLRNLINLGLFEAKSAVEYFDIHRDSLMNSWAEEAKPSFYQMESGSLHVKVQARDGVKAKEIARKIFDLLRDEAEPQSEPFEKFAVVVFNDKGVLKNGDPYGDGKVPLIKSEDHLEDYHYTGPMG